VQNICYFSDILFFPLFYGPNSLERYDKSELSNQSSDEELRASLQCSLHPSRRYKLLTKTGVTIPTSPTAQEATTRQDRERDILPSHLKI